MSPNWDLMRRNFVDKYINPAISDKRVVGAFEKVPRHKFVDREWQSQAYEDKPLPIGFGQTISQPSLVAIMTEALDLKPKDKVLEVGTGSGYQAALLSLLVKQVYSIERIPALVLRARKTLNALGYNNVVIYEANGSMGLVEEAPFDAIMVTAGAPDKIPVSLAQQLKVGGRIVIPVGGKLSQKLVLGINTKKGIMETVLSEVRFVPLIGEDGWS